MNYLFLAVVSVAYIITGLPNSLLGSAWPIIHTEIDVPTSFAGIITIIIAGCNIFSSIMSNKFIKKLGTGVVILIGMLTTTFALFMFSKSSSFMGICLSAIPFGLGSGTIGATLNGYVAINFNSRYMNWFYGLWGVGASISPYIMSFSLKNYASWHNGYSLVAYIQLVLMIVLFFSIPLWNKQGDSLNQEKNESKDSFFNILKIKGVKYRLFSMIGSSGLEATTTLWASSYLVSQCSVVPEIAAKFSSLFFIGITLGRFLCGFIANKIGDKKLIRYGLSIILLGIIFLLTSFNNVIPLIGIIFIGFGCSPIYPCIMHSTPTIFDKKKTQGIIGAQIAFGFIGSTFMPPLFGLIGDNISIGLYPVFLLALVFLIFITSEKTNKMFKYK